MSTICKLCANCARSDAKLHPMREEIANCTQTISNFTKSYLQIENEAKIQAQNPNYKQIIL